MEAARAKATVGEISLALERVFGRHQAEIRLLHDVYTKEAGPDAKIARAKAMVEAFTAADGRAPSILVAKMGQDGHDRGPEGDRDRVRRPRLRRRHGRAVRDARGSRRRGGAHQMCTRSA